MKKRLLAFALTPLFVLSLAACSDNSSTTTPGSVSNPAASTPVVSTPISNTTPVSTTAPAGETFDPISKANSTAGTYTVRGVVVGVNEKSFLINDGTGIIMVFLNATPSRKIGDYVEVSGTVVARYENYQFDATAKVTALTEEHNIPAITPVDYSVAQWDAYNGKIGAYISIDVEVFQSGSFFNFKIIPAEGAAAATRTGSFSYAPDSYGVDVSEAIGDQFAIEGFLVETNSERTRNTLLVTKAEKTKDNTVVDDSLIDVTFNKSLGGCTWTGKYDAEYYSSGAIKMNAIGNGVVTPAFEGKTALTVSISISAFNPNTRTRDTETDGWTVYGYDEAGNEVATGTHNIASASESTFNIELVSQTPITSVKIVMTNWFSDGEKCYNLGLGRIVVDAA